MLLNYFTIAEEQCKPEFLKVYLSLGDRLKPRSTVSVEYIDRLSHLILVDVGQHETRCSVQQQQRIQISDSTSAHSLLSSVLFCLYSIIISQGLGIHFDL